MKQKKIKSSEGEGADFRSESESVDSKLDEIKKQALANAELLKSSDSPMLLPLSYDEVKDDKLGQSTQVMKNSS